MGDKLRLRARLLAAAVIVLLLAAAGCIVLLKPPVLVISEVCAVNDGSDEQAALRDSSGDLCDWVELYNPNSKPVKLNRYTLCREEKAECAVSGGEIPAGGYALVYCTKDGFEDKSIPQVDLKIPKGESCTLTLKCGSKVIDSITTEPTSKGSTVCAGEEGAYITTPTPCAANAEAFYASQVVFSEESGFREKGFELEMTALNSEMIMYTLDGTDPRTSLTARKYVSPVKVEDRAGQPNVLSAKDPMEIQLEYHEGKVFAPEDNNVDKGTVVRACAKNSEGDWGSVSTATYFVGLAPADHNGLPVISLVTDPDALYDSETGIYTRGKVYEEYYADHPDHLYNGSIPANYNQRGREWERECTLQFFESDGSLKLSQDAGMRIQGGWSRADYQKSFRFYARSDYGKDSFDYCFWEGLETAEGQENDSFSTLVLRNGGNDSNFLKYKDILMQDMAGCLAPPTQTGRPCVLFIDGEYWGLYTLQEDLSQEYFARHYGVSEDSVAIYKNGELDKGLAVDELSFDNLREFIIGRDMSDDENYSHVCDLLDIDNFIDYCAMEMYIFNDDWPQNNYGCWRSNDGSTYGDGKWRFFLFDTESCACHYHMEKADIYYFEYLNSKSDKPLTKMILQLMKNKEFRQRLITRLADMGNIVYTKERLAEFEEKYEVYLAEMPAYYLRFPTLRNVKSSSVPMQNRMHSFFNGRMQRLSDDIQVRYFLHSPYTVEISGEGISLNGLEIGKKFEGKYFRDSELTLTAENDDTEWEMTSNGKTESITGNSLTVTITGDTEIKVVK
ncbi:CotH kinase family protein [Ruminococcus sp.]|uniref:CotH kinase family protein n=1 Tax=Ruminococcus sp. TaxID=41978 RepID=UPI0025DE024A|nr:CotH kinase family protein [Ruminococcus sp.]MBQ8967344.1 CotH kinase family protein [Ruminococcus sp.]